ncbi:MAG: thioredoxin fold domain-containing protein, partial [Treponema sp.]|nr:thioredoxin fold domain-containing protein [Treponema sp.]
MSEEIKEKSCCCKKAIVLALCSLILSIGAFGLTLYNLLGGQIPVAQGNAGKKVVISTQYDKGQTYAKAQETKKPMVVFFYTDWCGFCQRFAPTFHKIVKSKEIKKDFGIAYVNCEKQENSQLMQEYGIEGFPTVFVVKDGKKTQLENGTFFGPDAVEV